MSAPPYYDDTGFSNKQYDHYHSQNAPSQPYMKPYPREVAPGYGGSSSNPQAPSPYGQAQAPSPYPPAGQQYYHPTPIIMQPAPTVTSTSTSVVVNPGGGSVVGCPVCHNNSWTGSYPCCAWLLCIICFPVGIICCCCMRQKKCTHCGYTVG